MSTSSASAHWLAAVFAAVAVAGTVVDAWAGSAPPTTSAARAVATHAAGAHADGFFVATGHLYDPNGVEFRIRGVNRLHWDSRSADGIARSHANTVRWDIDFRRPAPLNVALVRKDSIRRGIVPVVGNWSATCSYDPERLQAVVDTWIAQARDWTQLDRYLIVNIANEWGPPDSPIWRDAYVRSIARLRAAGYRGPLLIDSGGCGQDMGDLLHFAAAVFDSDPLHNVLFALHVYGDTTRLAIGPDLAQLQSLEREHGLVFIVGEFGPGRRIGYTPEATTAAEVISACEAHDIGWLAWAWDDYDLPGGRADDRWFSMTYSGPGQYRSDADLTLFGRDVVLDPHQGLRALARPASIFSCPASSTSSPSCEGTASGPRAARRASPKEGSP
ncbi:MAG TPA: cellulase family glycosylhydrolase [Steroidobacteraceae bacterium]|nr:cellulase family glycosylhydrolase [Steroidobacteraceae bacterium]